MQLSRLLSASTLLALLVCPIAWGQQTHGKLKDVPAHSNARGAVERITAKKIMDTDSAGDFNGKKPVTRYELAITLDRFIQYIEGGKKPLNPTTRKTIPAMPKRAGADVKKALTHLVSQGFIDTNSPLLSEHGSRPVTANEFADALTQVTIRLSDRSLAPKPEN